MGLQPENESKNPSLESLNSLGCWYSSKTVESAVVGADAVLILTEWNIYRKLDWSKLASKMRQPAWVFDTRLVTEEEKLKLAGLKFWRVGYGSN